MSQRDTFEKAILILIIVVSFLLYILHYFLWKIAETTIYEFLLDRIEGVPLTVTETTAITAYMTVLMGLMVLLIFIFFKYREQIDRFKEQFKIRQRFSSQQGTAKWATVGHLNKISGKDGVLIGYGSIIPFIKPQEVRLSAQTSYEHIAIIGPTGCGKTTKFFIPNILTVPDNTSIVITDPKGELEKLTAPYLKERGWDVYTFSILNPTDSYNPLAIARKESEIVELANIMLQNGYSSGGQAGDTQWVNFALPLWEAALFAEQYLAQKENRTPLIENAYNFIIGKSEEEQINIVAEEGGSAYQAYLTFMQAAQSPETISSIKMVASTSLKLFTRPDIKEVMSKGTPFEPKWLREKPTAYFVQVPEHKANLIKPITATLYWQLFEHLIETPGLPIIFFMDEFANIGKIPGFAQLAATLRSRKISLNVCLQGVEQLSREYSREEQTDIINNLKTKIYFPASTGESGTQFMEIAGKSTNKIGDNLQSTSLLSSDELRRLPDNYIVVLAHNLNPVILKTIPWYNNKQFKKITVLMPESPYRF